MSQKKRLFFLKEDNIVSENKIIVLPIKTGMLICEPTDEEIENNIIYKKYLKSKIYPPELVKDSEKDTLYFENKQMCELLKNNECIKSMCSPDSFLKHLDNLILDIDFHICLTNNYLPRLENLSGNIIDLIEFSRTTSHKRWFNNYKNLLKIKKLVNSLMYETFDELLEMFYDLTDMKHNVYFSDMGMLKALYIYERIKKKFHELNKPFEEIEEIKLKKKYPIEIENLYFYATKEYRKILYSEDYDIESNNV